MTVMPVTPAEDACLFPGKLNPHPDGKPWPKCCGSSTEENLFPTADGSKRVQQCKCLMRKNRNGTSRFAIIMDKSGSSVAKGELQQVINEDGRFFCVHRQDGGYHRECAGWAAKFHPQSRHESVSSDLGHHCAQR